MGLLDYTHQQSHTSDYFWIVDMDRISSATGLTDYVYYYSILLVSCGAQILNYGIFTR